MANQGIRGTVVDVRAQQPPRPAVCRVLIYPLLTLDNVVATDVVTTTVETATVETAPVETAPVETADELYGAPLAEMTPGPKRIRAVLHRKPLKIVQSDRNGAFQVLHLAPATYSVLVEGPTGLYASYVDLDNRLHPVTVRPGKLTETSIRIFRT